MDIINSIIDNIKSLYNAKKEKKDALFNEYIEMTYSNTEIVYNDFKETLYKAKEDAESGCSLKIIIRNLEGSRLKFKSTRDKIRSALTMGYYSDSDNELIYFYVYICGILQGGMRQSVEERIIKGIGPRENLEELKTESREHTLIDLIERYKDIIPFYHEENPIEYKILYINDIHHKKIYLKKDGILEDRIFRDSFIQDIEHQIYSIDKYWEKLSNEYSRLKYKKIN